MKIANPIYDVIFKYLMYDNKIAKIIISKIIDEDIISLKMQPQELITKSSTLSKQMPTNYTVYRVDFAATIKTANGKAKQVIVEIQKAKYPSDIMRFRKYLAQQYDSVKIPIVSIYFLGFHLDNMKAPVIAVKRNCIDKTTNKVLKGKEEFIESLTHDSYIIQIPYLKQQRRNKLEQLLSIFDQSQQESSHVLVLDERIYPLEYKPIIRRLNKAVSDDHLQRTMDIEDEIVEAFKAEQRKIEALESRDKVKEKALETKDKAIEAKDKAIEAKDKTIENQDKTIENQDKALETKDKTIENQDKALKTKDKTIENQDKALEDKDKALKTKDKALETKDKEIEKLKNLLNSKKKDKL